MEKIYKTIMIIFGIFIVAFVSYEITEEKFMKLRQTETPTVITLKERERQLDCLARNIYYEAQTEPFEGKVGVAQVTLNRANSSKFPNDICQVVYQKNVFFERVVCQFSWYCEHASRVKPINKEHYDESYAVAKKVLLEGFRLDSLKEAIFYHADYVNPNWKKTKITKIGRHIFYKEI